MINKCKKIYLLVLLMISFLVVQIIPIAAQTSNFTDISGHWAQENIQNAVGKDIVKGYPDNSFKPDKEIIRAEFIEVINNYLSLKEMADKNYDDVDQQDWYFNSAAKAKLLEYIQGAQARPEDRCTREEVANVLAELLVIEANSVKNNFPDLKKLDSEQSMKINALVEAGYLSGYPDGSFKPEATISRAEILTMFSRALGEIVRSNEDIPAGDIIEGNITLVNDGIDLDGKTINGDLLISPGVLGKLDLSNVTVNGRIIISSGSKKSTIKMNNVNADEVIVKNISKTLNIDITGQSKIKKVSTHTPAEINTSKETHIGELDVKANAQGTQVKGQAKIDKAELTAKNVTLENKPARITVSKEAVKADVGGQKKYYDKPSSNSHHHHSSSSIVAVTGVKLKESTRLMVGARKVLTASVEPANATNKNLSWISSNTEVATVNDNGLLTAVRKGKSTIAVTTEDGRKTADCIVTVDCTVIVDMAGFAGGTGEEGDPFLITKLEHLNNVRNHVIKKET